MLRLDLDINTITNQTHKIELYYAYVTAHG